MSPPFDCSHCGRCIPGDMVATYDCSGCPLTPPCVWPMVGAAWPDIDGDDDGGGDDQPPTAPSPNRLVAVA